MMSMMDIDVLHNYFLDTDPKLKLDLVCYILREKLVGPYFIIPSDHQINRFQKKIIVQNLELKIVYHKNR